jgi:hypothetical protein
MATVKVSATLDAELVAEAKSQVGERGLSRYLNEALVIRLQRERLERLEEELAAEFGPVPEDVRREIDSIEWPR